MLIGKDEKSMKQRGSDKGRETESGRKNAIEEYRVRDSKVDERVGSHVDVKDRNCEFVDPRVEWASPNSSRNRENAALVEEGLQGNQS